MAQRFNAPPGWNVPPDFVPTADWQPDPSWPPAPEGWNYWVDDAAQAAPAYGTPSNQPYGTPADQGYGTSADQGTAPYGSASMPNSPYTAPVGAYGSTAPGSASAALGEAQIAGYQKAVRNGIIMLVAGIGLTIFTVLVFDRLWFFTPILALVGLIGVIKGNIDLGKARRAGGYGSGSTPPGFGAYGTTQPGQNPPGFTAPGTTPPGQNPPGF